MDKGHGDKADRSQKQAHDVSQSQRLEFGDHNGPEDRTHGLDGEHDAYPVAGGLVSLGRGVSGIPTIGCDSAVGICPHVHESGPAEELHETDSPEGLGGMEKKLEQSFLVCRIVRCLGRVNSMKLSIFLRVHLLDLHESVQHAGDQDGGSAIEAPDH